MHAEYMYHSGNDLAVINAAKVSFARASKEIDDKGISLINFLATGVTSEDREKRAIALAHMHDAYDIAEFVREIQLQAMHWTPFTHNSITLRCSAPIPIRTQCFKHKVGFTENEESRRYIKSTPVLFIPKSFRSAPSGNVKQGSGDDHPRSSFWLHTYEKEATRAIETYELMIEDGVAAEQARFILPQGVEVNWIWTGNLAAYARYFNQRTDSHAQGESRELPYKIGSLISPLYPISWNALTS